ncbi:acyltransferase ChoActase/COT/CPT [Xylariomycetidae sp. FL2044]|nr:acyltransferase ChoActase/COT/CPT [Xylariomycetidae sp. FL2044]
MEPLPTARSSDLPRFPLPPLKGAMEGLLRAAQCIEDGGKDAQMHLRRDVAEFLSTGGAGKRLQGRLEELYNDAGVEDWISDIYCKGMWLRERHWHPRGRNFYAAFPSVSVPLPQAERAALLASAAFDYKQSFDKGSVGHEVQPDLDMTLCMEQVRWMFNTNRTPHLERDCVDRWPENDFIIALRNGHAFRIPLLDQDGQVASARTLSAAFQAIISLPLGDTNWVSVLTTANRDEWAKARKELLESSLENREFVTSVEKSLFVVCLDDGQPTTARERFQSFVLDDNRNRWLDKTLNFVVMANGEFCMLVEHSRIDGSALQGIGSAILLAMSSRSQDLHGPVSPGVVTPCGYRHLQLSIPVHLDSLVASTRQKHLAAVHGWEYTQCTIEEYGSAKLRERSLAPKSVFQVVLQLAMRLHFGANPNSLDVISMRHFRGGRADALNATTAEMIAFCSAAWDRDMALDERKRLFLAAVRSHAALAARVTWGQGWWRHTTVLEEVARELGGDMPAVFMNPLYLKTKGPQKLWTTFLEPGHGELGQCWPERAALGTCIRISEDSAVFDIINGDGRIKEFEQHLRKASAVVELLLK